MSRLTTAVIVTGLVALTGGAQARQAPSSASFQRLWYQAYDEGVRAVLRAYGSTGPSKGTDLSSFVPIGNVDVTAAIANLESAKRSGPAPGRRVLFQGDRVDVFNPDYYLGLAYYASGRFADAEGAFARVANDKLLVEGDPQMRTFRKMSAFANYERLLADAERALRAGRFADVEKMWDVVSAPNGVAAMADQETLDGRAYELRERAREGAARLASAAPAAPTNLRIVAEPPPATNLPADDPKVAVNDPKTPVDVPIKAPDKEPSKDLPTTPVAVNRPPVTPAPKEPDKSTAGLGNPGRPSALLTDDEAALLGATAFFEGNYEEAVRVLTPAYLAFPPARIVTFYWACSKAALVASGRADRTTLTEPREVFASVKSDAGMDRHLRYISPRVREMLGDVPATAR